MECICEVCICKPVQCKDKQDVIFVPCARSELHLLHRGCQYRSRPGADDGLCVSGGPSGSHGFSFYPLLSHSPLPLSLLSFYVSTPSLSYLKRHLPLAHAIALCSNSKAAILTLYKDFYVLVRLSLSFMEE